MPDNVASIAPIPTRQARVGTQAHPTEIVILNDFSTAQGGATVIALAEARELRRQGYRVTWISGDGGSPELEAIGVNQVALGLSPLLRQPAWRAVTAGLHNTQVVRAIADWIGRNDRPDTVYHLHNWSQILSPGVFEALRPVESRLVVTCHDFFNICPNGGLTHYRRSAPCDLTPLSRQCLASQCDRRSAAQKYWRTLRQLRLNWLARFGTSSATFTFLHERMLERFAELGFSAPEMVTVRNPVEAWSRSRIAAEDNRGFLFVGRIGEDKGADLAIRAAANTGQKLTLIGSGELANACATGATEIEFAGWRGSAAIAELASTARALIVPSRIVEPFGLVVLEAAMSGLPVVMSSQAFLAPEAEALGFARTFDVGATEQLDNLLCTLARDDELVSTMSHAGFMRARSLCHSPVSWIDQLLQIFGDKLALSDARKRYD